MPDVYYTNCIQLILGQTKTMEKFFMRCIHQTDGEALAKKLAKVYVMVHLKLNHTHYVREENDATLTELTHHLVSKVESKAAQTNGRHAAILSALYLTDDPMI